MFFSWPIMLKLQWVCFFASPAWSIGAAVRGKHLILTHSCLKRAAPRELICGGKKTRCVCVCLCVRASAMTPSSGFCSAHLRHSSVVALLVFNMQYVIVGKESSAMSVRLAPDWVSSDRLHLRQKRHPRAELRGRKQHHGERYDVRWVWNSDICGGFNIHFPFCPSAQHSRGFWGREGVWAEHQLVGRKWQSWSLINVFHMATSVQFC